MVIQVITQEKNVVHVIAGSGPSLLSIATSQSDIIETKNALIDAISQTCTLGNAGSHRENTRDTTEHLRYI